MVQHKKYPYYLSSMKDNIVHFVCEGAFIDQEYLAGDIPGLLENLPDLILDEIAYKAEQREIQQVLRFH